MAQGPIKAKTAAAKQAKKGKPATRSKVSKKGQMAGGIEGSRIAKKYSASMAGRTEQLLGERAGHVELIGKGKKTPQAEKVGVKGGTRRYG